MMDSFLGSIWPKGLFGLNNSGDRGEEEGVAAAAAAAALRVAAEAREASSLMLVEPDGEGEGGRKRARSDCDEEEGGGEAGRAAFLGNGANGGAGSENWAGLALGYPRTETPGLIAVASPRRSAFGPRGPEEKKKEEEEEGNFESEEVRPAKRFRGERGAVPASTIVVPKAAPPSSSPSSPLRLLPEDALAHCLSFLGGVEDRYALQCTSTLFRRVSNSDDLRRNIQVGGDRQTGLHGIIREHDTPESATRNLDPFVQAGNLEAIYMLGIIKSYCHQDVEAGIQLLKHASARGYTRASYALGLALRDSQPEEASKYMKDAADHGYIPALQEVLPARKMKEQYGEPKADELRLHLDPLCLNRLLSRYYVQSAELREVNTSHCWNPLCGRWAFKACLHHNHHSGGSGHHPHDRHPAHPPTPPLGDSVRRGSESSAASSGSEASAATDGSSSPSSSSTFRGDSDIVATGSAAGTPTSLASSSKADTDEHRRRRAEAKAEVRVSRMKMCSRCCRAKYCSKLCQVYDWRSGRHKMECQFL